MILSGKTNGEIIAIIQITTVASASTVHKRSQTASSSL